MECRVSLETFRGGGWGEGGGRAMVENTSSDLDFSKKTIIFYTILLNFYIFSKEKKKTLRSHISPRDSLYEFERNLQ